MSNVNSVIFKGVEILPGRFRNFAGAPTEVNRQGGKRQFNIVVNAEDAMSMKEDGWNIKTLAPREDGDEERYYLPITVGNMEKNPVFRCILGPRKVKVRLTEDTIDQLDHDRISYANIDFRGWEYEPGKYSAWVNELHVYVEPASSMAFDEGFDDDEPEELPFE